MLVLTKPVRHVAATHPHESNETRSLTRFQSLQHLIYATIRMRARTIDTAVKLLSLVFICRHCVCTEGRHQII